MPLWVAVDRWTASLRFNGWELCDPLVGVSEGGITCGGDSSSAAAEPEGSSRASWCRRPGGV